MGNACSAHEETILIEIYEEINNFKYTGVITADLNKTTYSVCELVPCKTRSSVGIF
jgi:hypothetical protein